MADATWASSQLSRLIGIDEESAKQIVEYANSLSTEDAAEHMKNMLGDSPQALDFISTFNSRRRPASQKPSIAEDGPAKSQRQKKPQKKAFNNLPPPRQVESFGSVHGAYQKKNIAEDYMPGSSRHPGLPLPVSRDLSPVPSATRHPTAASGTPAYKPPPSAAGPLISDVPNVRSRQASPNPKGSKTKVAITGGTAMHGASSVLNDLDSAIRSLELQTNPVTANPDPAVRACDCLATRHPLLAVAPNCLACGKIVCAKEGLAPCTFCSTPLLTQAQIQDIIRQLREERGRERQNAHNAGQRKADVATTPRAFHTPRSGSPVPGAAATVAGADIGLVAAQAHRDKILGYQAQNAKRTRVHDEAADFETPSSGTNMWSSSIERAQQLKRQQKVLREMEWAAKPEYEKKRVVMSVDLVGGKVVKRYGTAKDERPEEDLEDNNQKNADEEEDLRKEGGGGGGGGAFGHNPLMGALIKPVWRPAEEGYQSRTHGKAAWRATPKWRRVQDDQDDNEEWILDGGTYGARQAETYLGAEEPACG